MDNKQLKVAAGGLLHDIGKILYRYNDGRSHSRSGYDFLKENNVTDKDILDQVLFHHAKDLRNADISDDSPAYITYWADNVAAGADRRCNDDAAEQGYDKYVPLHSVFNILNVNS